MGQDISTYLDHIHRLHISKGDDGACDLEDGEGEEDSGCEGRAVELRACSYTFQRTSIGSPTINRRSFTEEQLQVFIRENDGFPLPSTEEELKDFDREVFLESPAVSPTVSPQKKDRQRSKSTTAIPDLGALKAKLNKLQAPAKPKFLEHLISRVSNKKSGRTDINGLVGVQPGQPHDVSVAEELSPDTEKCLVEAESLVDQLFSCGRRPASGESTDSGKGSLLESTSDFSPTPKRVSWSTPTSPTLQGIVKQRLKNFKALQEGSTKVEASGSKFASPPGSPRCTTFQTGDNPDTTSLADVNASIKTFYCSLSHDETFTNTVMEKGYVKALVHKINEHHTLDDEDRAGDEAASERELSGDGGSAPVTNGDNPCLSDAGTHGALATASGSSKGPSSPRPEGPPPKPPNANSPSHVSRTSKKLSQTRTSKPKPVIPSKPSFSSSSVNKPHSIPSTRHSGNLNHPSSGHSKTDQATTGAKSSNHSSRENGTGVPEDTDSDVSAMIDVANQPLSPEELFEQSWSKPELSFDDFSDEETPGLPTATTKKGDEVEAKDKLQFIAEELLSTEKMYVSRLHLLDQIFYFKVTVENKAGNFIPQDVVEQIFSTIKPIYQFHHDFLLPGLEARIKSWSSNPRIGDLMKQFAPFLKLYSEYVKRFDHAMELINQWMTKSPKFAVLIHEIQQQPECGQLSLQHHMLEPIQRVPRYELFMKDYLKHLPHDSPDRRDAQAAQELVAEAASHSNTVLKKIDKFHKLLTILQSLNGDGIDDLVIPTRELVKEGAITKISARSGEKQARYIFLFNDLLLVCSEQMLGSYKLRARLSVAGMEILPGDNVTLQNTFCVHCTEKTVEFLDDYNNGEGLGWLVCFEQVVADYNSKARVKPTLSNTVETTTTSTADIAQSTMDQGTLGKVSPQWVKDDAVTMCMACESTFTAIKRRHHCRACGRIYCSKCTSCKARLEYDSNQINRVCQKCYDILKSNKGFEDSTDEHKLKAVKQVPADVPSVLSGYLNMLDKGRNWNRRWITIRPDFAMYIYKKHQDVKAICTLPLPGYEVSVPGEADKLDRNNTFKLAHKNTTQKMGVNFFQVDNEDLLKLWTRVLEKLVLLELPSDEDLGDKRLSAHSVGSSNSNSSEQS